MRRTSRSMIDVSRSPCGGYRTMSRALVLALCLTQAVCQLRPDYSDLPGKYCEERPENSQCCGNRVDNCGVSLLGTVCYCDQFCDRGLSGDCCPDFFALCLNETRPQIIKDCVYKGKPLRFGETVMDNCNPCTCSGSADHAAVVCDTEPCLVDPTLLARLNRDEARLGWSAANHSRFWGRTLRSGLLQLLGTDQPDSLTLARTFPVVKALHTLQLPTEFDARRRPAWAALIGPVQDQGWCGASWAVSTAGTASDRFSIQTGRRVTLSSQQLLDCVSGSAASRGCRGGQVDRAWNHLRWRGVSSAECHRYRSGQTGLLGRCGAGSPLAACRQLYRMQPSYRIASREMDIRHEIFTKGPVQALLRVEPDFFLYRSGVYHTSQRGPVRAAYHSVRILGWGEEAMETGATLPYWVVANSWGTGWGEAGLFRIRRGTNEADIETFVVGSWARTHRQRVDKRQGTADVPQVGHLTSQAGVDGRNVPQEEPDSIERREEDEPDSVESSGDDPTDHLVTSQGDPSDQLVAPDEDSTDHMMTSEGDNIDHLVTDAEEEKIDGLLVVDEEQTEDPPTSDTEQIDHEETPDEEESDPLDKPSEEVTDFMSTPEDKKLPGSKVVPEEDKQTADEGDTEQLVTSDGESTDHMVVTEETTEKPVGKREEDGHVVMPNESQTDGPVATEEETDQDVAPDPKPGGWLSGWGLGR